MGEDGAVSHREHLSHSAISGFFAIMDKWQIPPERVGELLGGMPCSAVYKLRAEARTLCQEELTRISYVVGIYKALHILLPEDLADRWVMRPNDNVLFRGRPPMEYMAREGIPGLQQVRRLLEPEQGVAFLADRNQSKISD